MEMWLWVLIAPTLVALAYVVGLFFSRGYHRGKREFLARVKREHCSN